MATLNLIKNQRSTVVYNTKTGKVKVYDDDNSPERKVFLPEERQTSQSLDTWQGKISDRVRTRNDYLRYFLAEALGTFVLVVFGVGSNAQAVLNNAVNVVPISLGWGFAVAFGVYACGGASGGHVNPAVTICFALFGRTKWRHVPFYLTGQYIGAFLGAFAVYIIYYNQLNFYDGGIRQGPYTLEANASTAGIWATYPQHDGIATWQGFLDQVFATGLLVLLAMAITDERNMQVQKGLAPLAIGFAVAALITAYSSNCGAALNPARDLAPRIFTAMAGWGSGVFGYRNYSWFWVPVIGPHIGAILGGWLYNICVGLHFPATSVKTTTISASTP